MEEELRQAINQIQKELQQTQPVDDKTRELLEILRTDIGALLEPPEQHTAEHYESISERLEDAIEHFEVTHPILTTIMSRLITALNSAQL